MKKSFFCGNRQRGIWEKEVHCFCDPFNYCVIVLQKRKEDLNIKNYFSLVYWVGIINVAQKEGVKWYNDWLLQGVTILW